MMALIAIVVFLKRWTSNTELFSKRIEPGTVSVWNEHGTFVERTEIRSFAVNSPLFEDKPKGALFRNLQKQTFIHQSEVEGYVFGDESVTDIHNVSEQVQSALVHDFSPFIERETRRRLLDDSLNIHYHVLSPAVMQIRDKILIAFRAWRGYSYQQPAAKSFPQDLFYVQEYTCDLRPTKPGYFLAHGYPKGRRNAEYLLVDGPQDPRAFKLKGRLYLTFHDGVPQTDHKLRRVVRTLIWDLETNRPTVLMIKHNVHINPLADKN